MNGNDFVKFCLRTPLRVLVGDTMLITVTGLKTGKKYSLPVGFYRDGDFLWVVSNRDRTWWRNLRNGAKVSLLLNGKTVSAFAEADLNEAAVEKRMVDYLCHVPMAARSFAIRMENQTPNAEDVARVAREKVFVRVKPS